MTDMQQIFAGMNELNERVHNAEARATHQENLHDRKRQRLYNRRKESTRLRRSTYLSGSKARTTSGENGVEFFAVGLGDFLVVRWQIFTNTLRDTATNQQPS